MNILQTALNVIIIYAVVFVAGGGVKNIDAILFIATVLSVGYIGFDILPRLIVLLVRKLGKKDKSQVDKK